MQKEHVLVNLEVPLLRLISDLIFNLVFRLLDQVAFLLLVLFHFLWEHPVHANVYAHALKEKKEMDDGQACQDEQGEAQAQQRRYAFPLIVYIKLYQ